MKATSLYRPGICDSGLNVWFGEYSQAKAYLDSRDHVYLLPYLQYFFICGAGHIEKIGLDPADEDWQKIGYDWVCPLDENAKQRLSKKLGLSDRGCAGE